MKRSTGVCCTDADFASARNELCEIYAAAAHESYCLTNEQFDDIKKSLASHATFSIYLALPFLVVVYAQ